MTAVSALAFPVDTKGRVRFSCPHDRSFGQGAIDKSLRASFCWALFSAQERREKYSLARRVRIDQGPDAAFELYRQLVREFPRDVSVATRLAASPSAHVRLQNLFVQNEAVREEGALESLRALLRGSGYTARTVASRLLGPPSRNDDAGGSNDDDGDDTPFSPRSRFLATQFAQAPLFVTSAAAGAHETYPWDQDRVKPLDVLIALFLVGLAVPDALLEQLLGADSRTSFRALVSDDLCSSGGNDRVLVRCETNPHLIYSLVQIMPVDLSSSSSLLSSDDGTLWIMTDWHPRTLSLTTIGSSKDANKQQLREDAVMYIGPDSMALMQHWLDGPGAAMGLKSSDVPTASSLLDLCTGSGIQAIVALRAHPSLERAVCVDVNPRALRFGMANARLNDVGHRSEFVLADLLSDRCFRFDGTLAQEGESLSSHLSTHRRFDLVTANPPFLPVPPSLSKTARHGLFSDGGRSGEDVLAAAVRLASLVLKSGGMLGVVSEFFPDPNLTLLDRIRQWWTDTNQGSNGPEQGSALLLTNSHPITVDTYAERRSDSLDEYTEWRDHLQSLGVTSSSPGLLFIRKGAASSNVSSDASHMAVHHALVPKSPWGSIWTSSNAKAIAFTRDCIQSYLERAKC